MCGNCERILDRLEEIEGEIAALYRELDGIDALLDECEQAEAR